ncbi:hypothetical protein Tco_0575031 [Tanacetum coccineum]
MDDPNITMEEYIRLEEEKARRQGQTFDWQTARYGKMKYYETEDSFTDLETEYPAIVLDDIFDAAFSREPTVSPLDNNEIDFNILVDESDDEDYMVVFKENSFSCKIIYVDNLKTVSEEENDEVNLQSSSSPEPTCGYIDDLDFFKDFENEFPAIVYNELKSKSDPLNEPALNELMELRDGAYENTRIYKERTKKWHDSRLRGEKDFKNGDRVLLFNSRLKLHPRKLKSKCTGPFVVKTMYPYGAVEIIDKDGSSFKVNGHRLKKYHNKSFNTEDNEFVELDI